MTHGNSFAILLVKLQSAAAAAKFKGDAQHELVKLVLSKNITIKNMEHNKSTITCCCCKI